MEVVGLSLLIGQQSSFSDVDRALLFWGFAIGIAVLDWWSRRRERANPGSMTGMQRGGIAAFHAAKYLFFAMAIFFTIKLFVD